ncbi:spore germination protein [Marinicrinis sediminis]|uniref:Spore germination protein n=1 Tax=Marinicrinis sediminis TaxID=1652465 RepID=A0ABW5RFB6_9BACL
MRHPFIHHRPPHPSASRSESYPPLVSSLEDNLAVIRTLYAPEKNSDFVVRSLQIRATGQQAVLCFFDTIVDAQTLQSEVIQPLLQSHGFTQPQPVQNLITAQNLTLAQEMKTIIEGINLGQAALFIDGSLEVILIHATKYDSRSIDKVQNEMSLKGPKEAFSENLASNISLVRKKIHHEQLYAERMSISTRSHNEVILMYNQSLVNEHILERVKDRLRSLDVDAIQNLGLLEQYIEDGTSSVFPTLLYSERPDRAASFLEDGHIILLMNNSPDCLILPATFWSFFHTSEDHYLKYLYGNFTRILRMMSIFLTLFTSAIYISITNYHSEMIPADLLLAIVSTREKVPLPIFFEVLLMEFAFELIREAGLRVPAPIGTTIGIVGALILGQSAVDANIISPIVIIIVAVSGLSSFAINDISLNFTLRILRFLFIISAGFFGMFGMTLLFMMGLFYMVTIKSFGVPYLAPMSPHYSSSKDTIFRKKLMQEKLRPGYLKTKDQQKKAKSKRPS